MPGGDRTGPAGVGPMTGRGMGYCAGNPQPDAATPFRGMGMGRGMGRGWGRGRGFGFRAGLGPYSAGVPADPTAEPGDAPPSPAADQAGEIAELRRTVEQLQSALHSLHAQVAALRPSDDN